MVWPGPRNALYPLIVASASRPDESQLPIVGFRAWFYGFIVILTGMAKFCAVNKPVRTGKVRSRLLPFYPVLRVDLNQADGLIRGTPELRAVNERNEDGGMGQIGPCFTTRIERSITHSASPGQDWDHPYNELRMSSP